MARRKVLITGMSGLIGGILKQRLGSEYELGALNRRHVPGVECHQADIADLDAILPAFDGKDAVVHLAAMSSGNASFEEVLRPNLIGTYNVFEAARRANVRRIVFASSGAVISGWERAMPYRALAEGRYDEVTEAWQKVTHETPVRPNGVYGCSKSWGESLARHFTDAFDLSIICVRIGHVDPENRPIESRHYSIWCSHRDIAQMVSRCIEAPSNVRFDIFHATSRNQWGYRDIEHARQVIGFEPEDSADDFR